MATVTRDPLCGRFVSAAPLFQPEVYLHDAGSNGFRCAPRRSNLARARIVATLGLALFWNSRIQAQSIVGNISTTSGVPIPGVLVTATRASPFQQLTGNTDASGNYAMATGLHSGPSSYNVVPSKAGYVFTPASSNVSVVVLGGNATANFTTPATVPSATTQPATNVTTTGATLQALVNPNGADTLARLEYGLTTTYGSSFIKNAGGGSSPVIVSINVTGLLNGTNYHFRYSASNSFGASIGADESFATLSGIPSVTTLDPTGAGATTMKLNGSVIPNGANATAWFDVGTTTNYGFPAVPQNVGAGLASSNFSQSLIGLVTATTYHYRAAASTSFGTSYGADVPFTPVFSDIGAGLPGVNESAVAWGDYNNDGRLDILLAGTSAMGAIAEVWRNTGSGFADLNAGLRGAYAGAAAWADYDNDGRLDIITEGANFSTVPNRVAQLWRNTGSGFVLTSNLAEIADGSVAWGDYDNDGRLDVLVTGSSNADPSGVMAIVYHNNGDGTFTDIQAGLPGIFRSSAAWGDYDNDGRPDILLTGYSASGPISQVWRNTGNGFVLDTNVVLPGVAFSAVAWGDYDNDGRLDILLTGTTNGDYYGAISQIWRNTGSGFVNINAALPAVSGLNNGNGSVAWGDYDHDGRLDILLTGYTVSGPISQVWRNTGNGFVNSYVVLPGVYDGSVAWGDFDNDGRLDILLTGSSAFGPIAQVWRNNLPTSNAPPSAPSGLAVSVSNTLMTLSWNAAMDNESPASSLTYNLRVGTTPGGSDVVGPMSAVNGLRRLPQAGNVAQRLSATLNLGSLHAQYYWSVQAVDGGFAGSPFAPENAFKILPVLVPATATRIIPGDLNGDGVVDQAELAAVLANLHGNGIVSQLDLDLVLSNYWPYSPWLYMTNVAGLGGTNVNFALSNSIAGAFSVEYTTNLMDWQFLGPAIPRYEFFDTNAPAMPQRSYRLRWP